MLFSNVPSAIIVTGPNKECIFRGACLKDWVSVNSSTTFSLFLQYSPYIYKTLKYHGNIDFS